MFTCCGDPNADDGAVAYIEGTKAAELPTDVAVDVQPVQAEPAQEPEPTKEPMEEAGPAPDAAPVAPAELPGPKGKYAGYAAWCSGICDGCGKDVEQGSPVDICYNGPAGDYSMENEFWRCPICCGGRASEAAQKASEEWSKAVGQGHVPVTFVLDQRPKTVFFSRRPTGISFTMAIPVVVEQADGHGKELGIEPNWRLAAVDGIHPGNEFHAFYCSFVETLNRLPGDYALPLLFKLPDGQRKSVVVASKPTGLEFTKALPAVVSESKDSAKTLGVEAGWKLLRFATKDVAEYKDFAAFSEAFEAKNGQVAEKK